MTRSRIYLLRGQRRLNDAVDIPARIAELRSVLVETRSEDVRDAIQAAIEDCRRQLAELEGGPGGLGYFKPAQ
jgi:hypothetical protein